MVNGQVTVINIRRYPADRVQPSEGMSSADWIKSGMKARQVTRQRVITPVSQLPAVIIDGILYASWMFIIAVGLSVGCSITGALRKWHTGLRPGSLRAAVREP